MKQVFLIIFVSLLYAPFLSAQPTNDNCETAFSLAVQDGCTIPVSGSNIGATASGALPIPSCSNFGTGLDVWYKIIVPANGKVVIELSQSIGGINDYALSVYSGTCGNLVEIGCNDDNGPTLFPILKISDQTPGATLYIRVWEFATNLAGRFNICAYQEKIPENDIRGSAISIPIVYENCTTITGTTVSATGDGDFSCDTDGINSGVWYTFVPREEGIFFLTLKSLVGKHELAIFNHDLTQELYCGADFNKKTIRGFQPRRTYYICVWSDLNREGIFELCLTAVPKALVGCTDPNACNYNPAILADNGTCDYVSCIGCTMLNAHNYNVMAEISDNSICETCSDGILNGDEQSIDCGGVLCLPCIGCQDFDLTLIGTPCDDGNSCTLNDVYTGSCNCEGTLPNLAIGKTATQSSTNTWGPELAIDGITVGHIDDASVSLTNEEFTPWWQIDLGGLKDIDKITIHNRTDCCVWTLSNYYVFVSDVPFTSSDVDIVSGQAGVGNYFNVDYPDNSTTIIINRPGRYVRVQLTDNNALNLAEVEIFGCDACIQGNSCDDGDPCTIDDIYGQNCTCAGTLIDPNASTIACDDGNPCTVNDSYDENCNCVGTFTDIDKDGICDIIDPCPTGMCPQCPDFDNAPIGSPCNDGDPCTLNDVLTSDCDCVGTYTDSDSDGICDGRDFCQVASCIRLVGLSSIDGNPFSITSEISLVDVHGQLIPKTNWSLHFVDSEDGVASAVAAFDNDYRTVWHSKWRGGAAPYPHIIEINLNDTYEVASFRFHAPSRGQIKDYEFYLSTDCTNWFLGAKGTWGNLKKTEKEVFLIKRDTDGDGICDLDDPCPYGIATEIDCNGIDDDCDPSTPDVLADADADGDGVCDAKDLCPMGLEPGMPCDDGHPCTLDYVDENCNCVGNFPSHSTFTNLALGKVAAQSSTYSTAFAGLAVDGDLNNLSHTGRNSRTSWWEVDLASINHIDKIDIYNRTGNSASRLSNFYVFVSDVAFSSTNLDEVLNQVGVSSYFFEDYPDPSSSILVNRTGQYVRIQLMYSYTFLHIREVEVLALQPETYYADVDGDGFGDKNNAIAVANCSPIPEGYVNNFSDFNDVQRNANPWALEVCDNIDNNNDGQIDEGIGFDGNLLTFQNESPATKIYTASQEISTNQTVIIESSRDVRFHAKNKITLNPGFTVMKGANFHAKIVDSPCEDLDFKEESPATARAEEIKRLLPIPIIEPLAFTISPNPFTNHSTISFNLPESVSISLQVYNINGQLVETITENQWKKAGLSTIEYYPKNRLIGMYYVVLKTDSITETKKIVITQS